MKTPILLSVLLLAACGPGEAMVLDDGTAEIPADTAIPLAAPLMPSENRPETGRQRVMSAV